MLDKDVCRKLFSILGDRLFYNTSVGELAISSFEEVLVEDIEVGDIVSIRSVTYDMSKRFSKMFLCMTLIKITKKTIRDNDIELVTSSNDVYEFDKAKAKELLHIYKALLLF